MSDTHGSAVRPWPRYAAVVLFLLAWAGAGVLLKLDANAYLLTGIPLTILFQLFARRQPLRGLWVTAAPPFGLLPRRSSVDGFWNAPATLAEGIVDGTAPRPKVRGPLIGRGIVLAVVLALVQLLGLIDAVAEGSVVGHLFVLASLVGAAGAGYALTHFRRELLRPFLGCLLITLALDALQWALFLGNGLVEFKPVEGGIPVRVAVGVFSLFQYTAVVFVIEEVTFRMLDSHLHPPGQGPQAGWGFTSAAFLAAAWALWHLPIADEELSWPALGLLFYVHVPYGLCLSYFWRRTGNLLIPGLCHALGDAIRNGIVFAG